ncbi:MAG: hypothetical protein K2P99_02165 [Burkholderiales bacterium]|nr:hypothetical protein [Burkholderiales bacterium]
MKSIMKNIYIDFKNYEILKIISERLNLLSWALSGLYGYFGVKIGTGFGITVIAIFWLILQVNSLYFAGLAQKYKKE